MLELVPEPVLGLEGSALRVEGLQIYWGCAWGVMMNMQLGIQGLRFYGLRLRFRPSRAQGLGFVGFGVQGLGVGGSGFTAENG